MKYHKIRIHAILRNRRKNRENQKNSIKNKNLSIKIRINTRFSPDTSGATIA